MQQIFSITKMYKYCTEWKKGHALELVKLSMGKIKIEKKILFVMWKWQESKGDFFSFSPNENIEMSLDN